MQHQSRKVLYIIFSSFSTSISLHVLIPVQIPTVVDVSNDTEWCWRYPVCKTLPIPVHTFIRQFFGVHLEAKHSRVHDTFPVMLETLLMHS